MQRNDEKIDVHRWREFGEELVTVFSFIRLNLGGILQSLLFIAGPFLLLVAVGFVFLFEDYFSLSMEATESPFVDDTGLEGWAMGKLVRYAFSFLAYAFVSLVMFEYVYLYAASRTGDVPLKMVWTRFRKDFFKVMLAKIIMLPMIAISAFCLAFPGMFMYSALGGAEMAIIQERANPFEAIGKSFSLMGKYFWGTVLLVFVLFMMEGFIGLLFAQVPNVLGFLKDAVALEIDENSTWKVIMGIFSGLSHIISYLLFAVPTIGLGLRYYACMEDRDGRQLKGKIRRIGAPEAEWNIFEEDEEY